MWSSAQVQTPQNATKTAIYSWTQSLRFQLEGTGVTVHELAPPGVQTSLMPGHRTSPHAMPFEAFIDEVMAILAQDPVPDEILVDRVKPFRNAEGGGRPAQTFEALNRSYRPLDQAIRRQGLTIFRLCARRDGRKIKGRRKEDAEKTVRTGRYRRVLMSSADGDFVRPHIPQHVAGLLVQKVEVQETVRQPPRQVLHLGQLSGQPVALGSQCRGFGIDRDPAEHAIVALHGRKGEIDPQRKGEREVDQPPQPPPCLRP
jgi:hypothetical protein